MKDVLIKLANAKNNEVVDERKFHENFYDIIRNYAGRAEKERLRDYKIIRR